MATATAETTSGDVESAVAQQRPYRMSYETYLKIAELKLIRPEEHVVLLDGILVQTMTKGPQHINAVDRGEDALKAALPPGWFVRDEDPVVLRDGPLGTSVPEPDLVVLIGNRERYEERLPEIADIGLVVEVASSSSAFSDDRRGLARYAFARIPTVWIVALHDRTIHAFTEPSGPSPLPGYARSEVRRWGELIEAMLPPHDPGEPLAVLGPIAVALFFPPAR